MDIFISYSRADKKEAEQFCKAFKDEGWSVWIDMTGIESGDEFKHKITEAIESCKVFVFLSSKNSNASRWVANEIGVASTLEKPIIPVKLDAAHYNKQVLMDLVNIDFIDYRHDKEEGMAKLMSSIRKKIGPGKKPVPQPAAAAKKDSGKSESLSIVIAVAACVVVLAGAILIPTLFGGRHSGSGKAKAVLKKADIEALSEAAGVSSTQPVKNMVPVEIKSVPSGALLALGDSNVRWVTPATIELTPGKEYTVSASLDGYTTLSEKFTVADSMNVLTITLQKKKSATPANTSSSAQTKSTDSQWIPSTEASLQAYGATNKFNDRASRVSYLVGSVRLISNPYYSKKGPVTIYMVVNNPNGELLTNNYSGTFTFNGKKIKYSASRVIDYKGEEDDINIYLEDIHTPSRQDSTYVYFRGLYKAAFYTPTQELGKAELLLR